MSLWLSIYSTPLPVLTTGTYTKRVALNLLFFDLSKDHLRVMALTGKVVKNSKCVASNRREYDTIIHNCQSWSVI